MQTSVSDHSIHISKIFSALGHPIRLSILEKLKFGETSIKELSKPFKISKPAMTKHLKLLQEAGLISRTREAKLQPAKLEFQSLIKINNWILAYKEIWTERLDRLNAYVTELKGETL